MMMTISSLVGYSIHNDQIWVLTEHSQKSRHLKNKWLIWDNETKTYKTAMYFMRPRLRPRPKYWSRDYAGL